MKINDLKKAKILFFQNKYDESFELFNIIALDKSIDKIERSNSFNMLGVIIIGPCPYLDPEDETGLKYFKKALELDPENLGALFNVTATFGTSPNMHRNSKLFMFAYNKLLMKKAILTEQDKKSLNEKFELMKKLETKSI